MFLACLSYILAFLAGAATASLVYRGQRARKPADAPPPAAPKTEKYGHPISPVAELKKGLPPPPPGFLWEITVERKDSSGHRFLVLKLLQFSTGKAEAQSSRNMDWFSTYGHSFQTHYKKYPSLSKEQARNHIVLPLVDWAMTEAGKRADQSGGPEHHEVVA